MAEGEQAPDTRTPRSRTMRSLLLTGLSLCAVIAGQARAAQLVVVESTTPKFQAGQIIDSAVPITLAAGSGLSLVGEDGKVRRLQGPFSGVPGGGSAGEGDKTVVQALSRLFASQQPSAQSWGTVRGVETLRGEEAANPPDVWAINLLRSESLCLPAGNTPMLWRPEASHELAVIVLHLATGREATLTFAEGEASLPWPHDVALVDGGVYVIRDVGNQWERRLSVRLIPDDQAGEVRQAAWMSDMGCIRQARTLISHLGS